MFDNIASTLLIKQELTSSGVDGERVAGGGVLREGEESCCEAAL